MANELPNLSNQITVQLELEDSSESSGSSEVTPGTNQPTILTLEDAYIKTSYVSDFPGLAKVSSPLNEKIIVYDCETTGTNPWDYRLIVASFWDLSRPISEMITFASFDEQSLIRDIADYLNTVRPYALVQYNNGFDERALLSRFMLYQVPVPGWNDIKQYDIMDILRKGTTQSISSSQPNGTEEQWFKFFFNEEKPYTIEECFEGVANGDLTRMILRNRTCTASEGYIYLLFRRVTDSEPIAAIEDKPTAVMIDEYRLEGACLVDCPACGARNNVPCSSKDNLCYRCQGRIPDPTAANVVKEVLRDYDFSKVGSK